jgi:hypothetical protein
MARSQHFRSMRFLVETRIRGFDEQNPPVYGIGTSVADPESGAFLAPGSGIRDGKNSGSEVASYFSHSWWYR